MVQYWILSYPRVNMKITIKRKLIGGNRNPTYERLYKEKLKIGDKIILYISKEYKIKGSATIAGNYFYDESIIWPPRKGEIWPHRRKIEIEKVYDDREEPNIRDFYSRLDLLEKARRMNKNLGKAFGGIIRGVTPKPISKHDYLLLVGIPASIKLSEVDRIAMVNLVMAPKNHRPGKVEVLDEPIDA